MKNKFKNKICALLTCLALVMTSISVPTFAESTEKLLDMTEGDVRSGFVPLGTVCSSTDPSVAWVDENGNLNALKPGTTTITVPSETDGQTDYIVTVGDYSDGSEIVGNLKLLARYNDSMQFYDGHVYLLFTSYQDGVEITVNDLYAAYEISESYYKDINEDIANGSNHTGSDADKYFTFTKDLKTVSLDRGEIVTIGMYRDFDLSVPQAALGSIKNSSAWNQLSVAGKSAIIKLIFQAFNEENISMEEALAKLMVAAEEIGVDYNKLLDGVVDGGVCFNRELYNQKLEWDQYENVTYEMDITRNQLNTLTMYLGENLNHFSILKNSCATVALRAWNAAVGTRNGEKTAYYLSSSGEGIFSIIDAPKSVRDGIVNKLPGYYLNNSSGVAEPEAGYQDDTGWVYVSAPEKVAPVTYSYDDDSIVVDEEKTKMATLVNAAKEGEKISYGKEEQQIRVRIQRNVQEPLTTIDQIRFTINDKTVYLDEQTVPDSGIWFKVKVNNPVEGEDYYVLDADGKALPSDYDNGWISFFAASLPVTYQIARSFECTQNILSTVIVGEDQVNAETEIYCKDGDEKIILDRFVELSSGTRVYIKSTIAADEYSFLLSDITLNGESVMDEAHYDPEEAACYFIMPEKYTKLRVAYEEATLFAKEATLLQVSVGDALSIADYVELHIGNKVSDPEKMEWKLINAPEDVLTLSGKQLEAVKEGSTIVWACAVGNENIGIPFIIEVYEDTDNMVKISYNEDKSDEFMITAEADGEEKVIPFSGYLVKKGSAIKVVPVQEDSDAILLILSNNRYVGSDNEIIADEDTKIEVVFTGAAIQGVPGSIHLDAKGDSYQLQAEVKYSGLLQGISVYDNSIRYESSDPLVTVDETGLITVAQDVPEEGRMVIVTAYAGSSNDKVFSACRVIVGDYQGSRIVGRLTIYARPISTGKPVPHSSTVFTAYEDVDLDVSYYRYYKPNDKYNDLMIDYDQNPEKYDSDPALYNDNALNLTDRESYFDILFNGAGAKPETISLKAGESISMSNYGYDKTNLIIILKVLEGSTISSSADAQELITQMQKYVNGEEIDGEVAFDSFFTTLVQMYAISKATGHNPVDGHSEGGMDINREIYTQFVSGNTQTPNHYYTIEITADELAMLKNYLANPDNNYYSLFVKNCATAAVGIWNETLDDRPELQVTANLTGLTNDPESLYYELGGMIDNRDLEGEGGNDFYPRTIRYPDPEQDIPSTDDEKKDDTIPDDTQTDDTKSNEEKTEDTKADSMPKVERTKAPNTGDLPTAIVMFAVALVLSTLVIIFLKRRKESLLTIQ